MKNHAVKIALYASIWFASGVAAFPLAGIASRDPGSRNAVLASYVMLACTLSQVACMIGATRSAYDR